ncbi:unnamed protein product [Pedinophyceae sp. YPF-701]|nr:unnamed protein product [Pedinophyceae sp. YPF-701]
MFTAAACSPTLVQVRRGAPSASRATRVVARAEEEKKQGLRGLDFTPNRNAAVGFQDEDSAGQTNIFAVEPKSYLAGSTADTSGGAPLFIALAFGIGAAVVVGGGVLNSREGPVEEDMSAYATLTEYVAKLS